MRLRRWIRLLAPSGLVDLHRTRAELARLGVPTAHLWGAIPHVHLWTFRLHLLPSDALPELSLVVDVGANVGRWIETVRRLAPDSQFVAVEPHPRLASRLRELLPDAEVLQTAAGEAEGAAQLHVARSSENSSLLRPKPIHDGKLLTESFESVDTVNVRVARLDDLLEHHGDISLLKIDVQGYEHAVLAGAEAVLSRTRWVLIEANLLETYEDQSMFRDVDGILVEHGFDLIAMTEPERRRGMASYADALYERIEAR